MTGTLEQRSFGRTGETVSVIGLGGAALHTERTGWLESQGIHVLRFRNSQVLKDIETVKRAILQTLTPPR